MRVLIPLREALADPKLLGDILVGDSWARWKALLLAAAGEALTDEEREHFRFLTGRDREPGDGVLAEVILTVGGRRGGKSRAMTTWCAWLASCVDWSDCLSIGERGRIMVVAPTIDQASNTMGYLRDVFHENALLASLVEKTTQDEIHLKKRIIFEVQAASAAHSRGKTAICVFADESAFLKSGDDVVDSDANIFQALRPCLASTNGPLILTSSPSGEDGVVYDLYRKFYRPDADPHVIVARGSTKELNPRIRDSVIDKAYAEDPEGASSEYGAEFRAPSASYISREIIERCIERGVNGPRRRLPGITYFAHCDPAHGGTGRDSFAMCIGHTTRDGDRDITVIDLLHEDKPGFDPLNVVAHISEVLKAWNITEVMGDQAGKPYITAFARHGIRYKVAPISTSEIYMHALPSWTSGTVSLHDNVEPLVRQLIGLKRRIGQGGRESIDHAKSSHAHDDVAVCVCCVIYQSTPVEYNAANVADIGGFGVFTQPRVHVGDPGYGGASDTMHAWLRANNKLGQRAPDGGPGTGRSAAPSLVWALAKDR